MRLKKIHLVAIYSQRATLERVETRRFSIYKKPKKYIFKLNKLMENVAYS